MFGPRRAGKWDTLRAGLGHRLGGVVWLRARIQTEPRGAVGL